MEGMGKIVATVSGYHGSERFKLIKLISLCGANYVGALNRSTTHLVCWKFKGEKYQLAKKFGTVIVNHKWFEDCLKEGKRIPEEFYTLLSGQEVGAIKMEAPAVFIEAAPLGENKLVLNGVHKASTDLVIDVDYENTGHHDWDDRWLLNKSEESSKNVSKPSRKLKKKIHDGTTHTTSAEPSYKNRRLVKRYVDRYNSESPTTNGNERLTNTIPNGQENVASTSNHCIVRKENEARTNERSKAASTGQRCARNQVASEVEIIEVLDMGAINDTILQAEEGVTASERTLQETQSDTENLNAELKTADQIEQSTRSPTSLDLSCVICWTQFSSTRGVLPCGHRFCFSCIQNWADCTATKGKTSTCPLCKSAFMTITKVDGADCVEQKIYSQTIPCASSTQDIFILPDVPPRFDDMQITSEIVCSQCHSREPEDLLIHCDVCNTRCIHCYCLDPPLFPWICSSCKDLRMFYPRS